MAFIRKRELSDCDLGRIAGGDMLVKAINTCDAYKPKNDSVMEYEHFCFSCAHYTGAPEASDDKETN